MERRKAPLTESAGYSNYLATSKRLLEGLILYRAELGEQGRQLERLLRAHGVVATTDLPSPKRLQ